MGLKNTYQARKRFTKTPVKSTGMWYQDGDVVVPSNQITMKGPQGQPNYFNSPILGIGMQSGQQQVMQPGREYLFPNDQSVFETKMQNGGWLDQYQDGGETSTEKNPERIDPVYIKKSKSFFDKATGKYRNFMRNFLTNDIGRNLYLNYTTAKDAVGMVTDPITKIVGETIPKDILFNRVRPVDYPESNPLLFAFDTYMRLGDKDTPPLKDAKGNYAPSEEIWRKALGYNDSFNYIEPSQYKPSKTKENNNAEYVRFKNLYNPQKIINAYVEAQKKLPPNKTSAVIPSLDPYITNRKNLEASGLPFSEQDPLQNFTLDKGQDEKGKYISLYDKYDFSGPANNLIYGFRKPIEIYDRIYYEKDKNGRPTYIKKYGGLQQSYKKTKRFK
jgi:hypothetical protein